MYLLLFYGHTQGMLYITLSTRQLKTCQLLFTRSFSSLLYDDAALVLGGSGTLDVIGRGIGRAILIDIGDVRGEENVRQGDGLEETIRHLHVVDFRPVIMLDVGLQ